ncbi:MAG: hypothetical protein M3O71_07275 [Bacteroidota bacterium]|nr:hypothetical protein [Bacteroidota bacterium]
MAITFGPVILGLKKLSDMMIKGLIWWVSHGSNRDLVYIYAILDYKVFRSLRWRDQKPGDVTYDCRTAVLWQYGDDNFGNIQT